MSCGIRGCKLRFSEHDHRIKVWDDDSLQSVLVQFNVCQRCAEEVAEMIEQKRRALI